MESVDLDLLGIALAFASVGKALGVVGSGA